MRHTLDNILQHLNLSDYCCISMAKSTRCMYTNIFNQRFPKKTPVASHYKPRKSFASTIGVR